MEEQKLCLNCTHSACPHIIENADSYFTICQQTFNIAAGITEPAQLKYSVSKNNGSTVVRLEPGFPKFSYR